MVWQPKRHGKCFSARVRCSLHPAPPRRGAQGAEGQEERGWSRSFGRRAAWRSRGRRGKEAGGRPPPPGGLHLVTPSDGLPVPPGATAVGERRQFEAVLCGGADNPPNAADLGECVILCLPPKKRPQVITNTSRKESNLLGCSQPRSATTSLAARLLPACHDLRPGAAF